MHTVGAAQGRLRKAIGPCGGGAVRDVVDMVLTVHYLCELAATMTVVLVLITPWITLGRLLGSMERHAGSPARNPKRRGCCLAACGENYDAVSGCKTRNCALSSFTRSSRPISCIFLRTSLQQAATNAHADERVACSDEWVRQTFFPSCSASSHHGASQRRLYALDGL